MSLLQSEIIFPKGQNQRWPVPFRKHLHSLLGKAAAGFSDFLTGGQLQPLVRGGIQRLFLPAPAAGCSPRFRYIYAIAVGLFR